MTIVFLPPHTVEGQVRRDVLRLQLGHFLNGLLGLNIAATFAINSPDTSLRILSLVSPVLLCQKTLAVFSVLCRQRR